MQTVGISPGDNNSREDTRPTTLNPESERSALYEKLQPEP